MCKSVLQISKCAVDSIHISSTMPTWGAMPTNVVRKNMWNGMPTMGLDRLTNQFGRRGLTLRNSMKNTRFSRRFSTSVCMNWSLSVKCTTMGLPMRLDSVYASEAPIVPAASVIVKATGRPKRHPQSTFSNIVPGTLKHCKLYIYIYIYYEAKPNTIRSEKHTMNEKQQQQHHWHNTHNMYKIQMLETTLQ